MGLYFFFNSYAGMLVVQSVLHSLIAMVISNLAVSAWHIKNPVVKQRFYFFVILAPVFSFQLFHALRPERGSIAFRSGALFDSMRWLNLEIMGTVPFGLLLLLLLILTSLIFLFQEFLPVLKQTFSRRIPDMENASPVPDFRINEALKSLPGKNPEVHVIMEDDLLLFSRVGKSPAIFISTGLLKGLGNEGLRAALAHEIAHIRRSRRPILVIVFILRMVMFYNPVVLLEFRRIVQEEEKICDDTSVLITGDRPALAEALAGFHYEASPRSGAGPGMSGIWAAIEKYSHNFLLDSRIRRLAEECPDGEEAHFFKLLLTFLAILSLSYLVV